MDRAEVERLAGVSEQLSEIRASMTTLLGIDDSELLEIYVSYPEGHAREGEVLGTVSMSKREVAGMFKGLESATVEQLRAAGVSDAA